MSTATESRTCDVCGASYIVVKPWQKRCSIKCNSMAGNARRRADPSLKRCRTCLRDLSVSDFEPAHRSCRACEGLRDQGLKLCKECKEAKPLTDFHRRPARPDGRESSCRACKSAYSRSRNADPDRRRRNRENSLRLKYGIGIADVEAMLKRQDFRCDICRTDQEPERFHVDHDHKTGAVRAMLCLKCNALLGQCGEQPRILLAAIDYLERHKP